MAIDFKLGTDSEEKRFLAGILLVYLSELLKRFKMEKVSHEMKKPSGFFGDSDFHSAREDMARYEALRKRGVRMIGGDEWSDRLDLHDYEVVCDLLTRFDAVRDVMES